MTLKQFKNNIWLQLTFLLFLAVVCGLILGSVWYFSQKYSKANSNESIYDNIYGKNFVYTKIENFTPISQTTTRGGTVSAIEKVFVTQNNIIDIDDAQKNAIAKIIKITGAYKKWVSLDMYVIVENSAVQYIYFNSIGSTFLNDYKSFIKNNKLQLTDFTSVTAPTAVYTQDVIMSAIKLAINV